MTTTQSAAPRAVATTMITRLDTAFAAMNPARESGLQSISAAVPARRSPATTAAPVTMIASSATCARFPMNCR